MTESEYETCPDCGEEYKSVPHHIAQSDCSKPVEAEAEVQEAKAVPTYDGAEESYGFDPSEMTEAELEAEIESHNERRRDGDTSDDEEYWALHDALRAKRNDGDD